MNDLDALDLTEDLMDFGLDAIRVHGENCLHKDPLTEETFPVEEAVRRLLVQDIETTLEGLKMFLEAEDEGVDLDSRQNMVRAILRCAEGLPGLIGLYSDPTLEDYI